VRYAAKAVNAGKLPLKRVAMHIKLDDGVLNLEPFAMEFPQGKLAGNARIDARQKVPQTVLDVRLNDLKLDQFVPKKPDAQPPFAGVMQARLKMQGAGDSVHDMASTADGTFTLVVPQGEVRAAFAELTGINVAKGLGLLLAKDEKASVRCGVADFKVDDGVMRAKHVVFDTEDVLITGRGEVRLDEEELDLEIKGQPKELRLMRLRTPIKVGGHMRKPAVGIDAGKTAGQAGIAAAIGALVAPLAAVVAFVDPGLAEDADCASLFAEARKQGVTTESEAPVRVSSDR
jgi:AsmA family protein